MHAPVKLRGAVTPEDRAAAPYCYLPFTVPDAVERITLRYRYGASTDADAPDAAGNAIDLGVFDARGTGWMSEGFRGWSGNARRAFTITERSATPGYIAGPLMPGEWKIVLGLYQVAAEGCPYEVSISFDPDPAGVLELPLPARAPRAAGGGGAGWYRGDFHTHSYFSDGRGSLDELVAGAAAEGLDFLAVMDHNTTSHWPFLAQPREDILLIAGQEVTTYWGHMNAWGGGRWLDFRCWESAQMERLIQRAHDLGAICSANHPAVPGMGWTLGDELPVDTWEVWNGLWAPQNRTAVRRWEALLGAGRRLVAVGGSDHHQPPAGLRTERRAGTPTTWVYAESLTVEGVLRGLLSGRVCVSASPGAPRLELSAGSGGLTVPMGGTLRTAQGEVPEARCLVIGGEGCVLRVLGLAGVIAETQVTRGELTWEARLPEGLRYIRAELLAAGTADRVLAISNPVYLEPDAAGR